MELCLHDVYMDKFTSLPTYVRLVALKIDFPFMIYDCGGRACNIVLGTELPGIYLVLRHHVRMPTSFVISIGHSFVRIVKSRLVNNGNT